MMPPATEPDPPNISPMRGDESYVMEDPFTKPRRSFFPTEQAKDAESRAGDPNMLETYEDAMLPRASQADMVNSELRAKIEKLERENKEL